jgi:hypothetical protein
VGQFLDDIGVILDSDDEVNPLIQTQIRDGMLITVTRVEIEEDCTESVPIPYETEKRPTQNLPPGEEQVAETGENGEAQLCYRIVRKNGVETARDFINRVTLKEPRNEIIFVGSEPPDTLIPVEGILTYISGGQAWIIQSNTANANPLTQDGFLDGRVFDLSADGKQLLYTLRTAEETDPEFSNELWAILDTTAPRPRAAQLIEDVRVAQWVRPFTVSYSTASPQTGGAGWQAFNDLFVMQIDPETGEMRPGTFEEIIQSNALGVYAYWGRRFEWSPDGARVAWANADSVGLVDLATGEFNTLLTFAEYAPLLELIQGAAVWVPTLSWSDDGILVTTLHGEPYADEGPENSIIFDMAIVDVNTGLQIRDFLPQVGIWSVPTYSPLVTGSDGNPTYAIAYFKARNPLNSRGSEYDLWVADRDGSNARLVFPGLDRPGLRSPDPEDGIAWSPNARQIALIYQSNLWIVDLNSGQSIPITSDGLASRPRWSRAR